MSNKGESDGVRDHLFCSFVLRGLVRLWDTGGPVHRLGRGGTRGGERRPSGYEFASPVGAPINIDTVSSSSVLYPLIRPPPLLIDVPGSLGRPTEL